MAPAADKGGIWVERLTKVDGCGENDLIRCFDCTPEKAGVNLEHCGYCEEGWRRALNKLAAYEDTGLTPEEVKYMVENAEARLLAWFEAKYGFPVGRLMDLCEAEKAGRMVVLDTPMLPLIWGDDNHDTILCPKCEQDLMGGFELAGPGEDPMFQCPRCGQPIDATKALTREEAEKALEGGVDHG